MENSGIYDQEGWSSIITLHKVYWGWTDRLVMWGADSSVFTTTTSIFLPLLLACYSVFSPSHSQPSDVTSGTTTTTVTLSPVEGYE